MRPVPHGGLVAQEGGNNNDSRKRFSTDQTILLITSLGRIVDYPQLFNESYKICKKYPILTIG
jgi:hypothetical protein